MGFTSTGTTITLHPFSHKMNAEYIVYVRYVAMLSNLSPFHWFEHFCHLWNLFSTFLLPLCNVFIICTATYIIYFMLKMGLISSFLILLATIPCMKNLAQKAGGLVKGLA